MVIQQVTKGRYSAGLCKEHKMAETMSGSPSLVGAVFIKPDSEENDSLLGFDSFVY